MSHWTIDIGPYRIFTNNISDASKIAAWLREEIRQGKEVSTNGVYPLNGTFVRYELRTNAGDLPGVAPAQATFPGQHHLPSVTHRA